MKKIKKLALSVALIALNFSTLAQVGIGTSTPDASAALDVESTTKGILFPRMTKAQLEGITPVAGLTVYCTDCVAEDKGELQTYNGSSWVNQNNFVPASGGTFSGDVGIGTSSPNQLLEVANTDGATINISTDESPGSINSKKYMNLDFSGYNNIVMARVQSWDESQDTGNGYLTFHTNSYDHTAQTKNTLVERMRIDNNGKVGIGTSSPTAPLTVNNDTDHSDVAIFHAGGGVPDRGLKISTFYNTNANAGVDFNAQHSSGALKFSTNSTERMRILTDGNITVSTSDAYLYSNARSGGTKIDAGFKLESSHKKLEFWTADVQRMAIDSIGNVGIGTSPSPSNKLEVEANNQRTRVFGTTGWVASEIGNNGGALTIGKESASGGEFMPTAGAYDSFIVSQGAVNLVFGTDNTERMRIDANGKVTIKGDLEVEGSIKDVTCSSEIADDSIVNADINTNAAIDGSKIDPDFGDQNISTTGNVGIGIPGSLSNKLEIGDADGIGYAISIKHKQYGINIETTGGSDYGEHPALRVVSTGIIEAGETNSLFRVSNNGNVGIGTDDPKRPLHIEVSGEGATNELLVLRASDDAYADLVMADKNGSVRLRNHRGQFQIYTGGDGESVEAKNSNIAMRIDENGKVTINGDLEVGGSIKDVTCSSEIADDSIVNADINTNAAIDGSKIDPDFGDQNISTTGNVGIGASSLDTKLYVNSGGKNVATILESTDEIAAIQFKDPDGTAEVGNSGNNIILSPGGEEKMRIDANGNVGIGVVPKSWSSHTALQVGKGSALWSSPNVPEIWLSENVYYDGEFKRITTNNAAAYNQAQEGTHKFYVAPSKPADSAINWTEAMTIDNNGNVGIGTSTPSGGGGIGGKVLHLKSDEETASIRVERGDSNIPGSLSISSGDFTNGVYSTGVKPLCFSTNGIQRMSVDANGNVGIGTSNPSAALVVETKTNDNNEGNVLNSHPIFKAFNNSTSSEGSAYSRGLEIGAPSGNVTGPVYMKTNTGNRLAFLDKDNHENLTILDNGNVGIGTDDPKALTHIRLQQSGNGVTPNINADELLLENNSNAGLTIATENLGSVYFGNSVNNDLGRLSYSTTDNSMQFFTNKQERMRIDPEGNFLVGTTNKIISEAGFRVIKPGQTDQSVSITNTSSTPTDEVLLISRQAAVTDGEAIQFYRAGAIVGSITLSSESTAYNTTSDYRLKENVQPIINASNRLMELKPVNFAWKVDGSRIDGFLAHEVDEVVPNAVSGDKDAVDEEGNPEYQSLDHSKLVPLLTAALQEALDRVEALEKQQQNLIERLEALENK